MKTTSIHFTLALLSCAIVTAKEPGEQNDRRPPPVPPLMAFFDADLDGVLSADEIQIASDALAQLDKNGDGEITKDEMPPPNHPPGNPPSGKRPPPPPVIAVLDADMDGVVSAKELDASPESLRELDMNHDDELTPEELHPHGPPPPHGGEHEEGAPQGPPPAHEDADVE